MPHEIIDPMTGDKDSQQKILLVLLPFWTPLIPPLGLACLKGFLSRRGFPVKTVDANTEEVFREFTDRYFASLQKYVPVENWSNYYVVGKDLLQNHLMACLNYSNRKEYMDLVKILIAKTFFVEVDDDVIHRLNEIIDEFYRKLKTYLTTLLSEEKPSVLGLSVFESSLPASLYAARLAKKSCPGIKTVMGGGIFAEQLSAGSPNWTLFLEKTKDYIDTIIMGEGEILFHKFLENQLPESKRIYSLTDIDGETVNLASVDLPDLSDFNLDNYLHIPAYTSRSCPFQCKFCSETVQWGEYRKKEAKQIVAELTALYKKYRRQSFWMCDSLLNPVITGLAKEILNTGMSIYWEGHIRIDKHVTDTENTILWRRGGFYKARIGIESGSPHVLKLMNKKISIDQIKAGITSLAYAGIKTCTYWVIGFPGETREDFQQTLDLIEELKDDIYEAWCTPFTYYPTGQVNTGQWANKAYLLYPQWAKDMLILQTWGQDATPSREETYRRMNLFVQHYNKLGIFNPHTLQDICKADERWKRLHPNSVPALSEFDNKGHDIDENKKMKKLATDQNPQIFDTDFGF